MSTPKRPQDPVYAGLAAILALVSGAPRTVHAGGSLDVTLRGAARGVPGGVWAIVDETLNEKQWAWLRRH